jgi:hypothetical protein
MQQIAHDVFVGNGHRKSFHDMLLVAVTSVAVKRSANPGKARRWAMERDAVLLTVPTEMPRSC